MLSLAPNLHPSLKTARTFSFSVAPGYCPQTRLCFAFTASFLTFSTRMMNTTSKAAVFMSRILRPCSRPFVDRDGNLQARSSQKKAWSEQQQILSKALFYWCISLFLLIIFDNNIFWNNVDQTLIVSDTEFKSAPK